MLAKREAFRAVNLGGFCLNETGVSITGDPDVEDFSEAIRWTHKVHHASGLWLADLLHYAESRPDWSDVLDAVIDSEMLTEKSANQYRSIAKRVPPERRVPGVGIGIVGEVASLPAEEQTGWLTKARDEHWTSAELRAEIGKTKRTRVVSGQASDIATAESRVTDAAWLAREACGAIGFNHCAKAASQITEARKHLDRCEKAVTALRKLTGKST